MATSQSRNGSEVTAIMKTAHLTDTALPDAARITDGPPTQGPVTDEQTVTEREAESFPASDPPANY